MLLAQVTPQAAGGGAAEFWTFIFVGALALGSAIAMVMMRNAVHAALMLVLNFFALAVLYAVLEAQFLAVVQIIVYAGAIMVLFLFVIMLLGVATDEPRSARLRGQRPVAVALGVALFVVVAASAATPWLGEGSVCGVDAALTADGRPCEGLAAVNAEGNVRAVGEPLFTDYVWPFEVMSALLVIAAIGAIVLGKRFDRPEDLVEPAPPEPAPVPESQPDDEAVAEIESPEAEEGER